MTSSFAYRIHYKIIYLYAAYYVSSLSKDLNFLKVITYKKTKPKLKTSDLKGLLDMIFVVFIFISYGAKKGTVPSIVAY